jgi:hypothetical protein
MPASRCPLCGYQGDDFARRRDGRVACPRCGEVSGEAGTKPIDAEGRAVSAGTALAAVGALTLLGSLVLVLGIFFTPDPPPPPPGMDPQAAQAQRLGFFAGKYVPGPLGVALGFPATVGGVQLARRRTWPVAFLGAIAAMIPCSCGFVLGLPIGIWALVVLVHPAVRASFR